MVTVSVVIITKNEAGNIADCIRSAKKISNDIIVIDSGSTDATISIVQSLGVKFRSVAWRGYGYAKNQGALLATSNWVLSLDADERITDELACSIAAISFSDEHIIYGFKRINYFGNQKIRYGAFAHDRVFRLYNKLHADWNGSPVHEKLVGKCVKLHLIEACAIHYAINNEKDYLQKSLGYAVLCAYKYKEENKKFVYVHRLLSPTFAFVKSYIFQGGFLDPRIGLIIASINIQYTRKKYNHLLVLLRAGKTNKRFNPFQHLLRRLISFLS